MAGQTRRGNRSSHTGQVDRVKAKKRGLGLLSPGEAGDHSGMGFKSHIS